MIKKILLVSFLTMFLFVGAGQAQVNDLPDPGILPDSPFYFLKSLFEGIGTFFTFGEIPKAERFLNLAEKRLAESKALAEKGKSELAQRMIYRHQEQLNLALTKAEQARAKGLNTDEVLAKVSEATLRHQAVLAEVYERVPEQAKPAIERAMENSMQGHEQALKAISGEKQEEIRQQIERKKEEVRERLEELRGRGVPISTLPIEDDFEKDELGEEDSEIVEEFCGWSTFGDCISDTDCIVEGCSSQVCQSKNEEPNITTCEFRECYLAENYGLNCKCLNNKCQWSN